MHRTLLSAIRNTLFIKHRNDSCFFITRYSLVVYFKSKALREYMIAKYLPGRNNTSTGEKHSVYSREVFRASGVSSTCTRWEAFHIGGKVIPYTGEKPSVTLFTSNVVRAFLFVDRARQCGVLTTVGR